MTFEATPLRAARAFFALLAAMIAAMAMPAASRAGDASDAQSCVTAEAHEVSFADLVANPSAHADQCVRVRGVLERHLLFADLESVYRITKWGPEHWQDAKDVALVLTEGPLSTEGFKWDRREVEVVGYLKNCGRPRPAEGFCHWSSDLRISAALVNVISDAPLRLVGDKARAKYTDMSEVDAAWEHYAEVSAMMRRWFESILHQDRDAFFSLTGIVTPAEMNDHGSAPYRLFNMDSALLRNLRGRGSVPEIKLFEAKFDRSLDPHIAADHVEAIGCICLKDDCTGLWPISARDAALVSDLPYACAIAYSTDGPRSFRMGFLNASW